MGCRHGWLLLSVFCLSCHTLTSNEPQPLDSQAARNQRGPEAVPARNTLNVASNTDLVRNHLSLAAAHLQQGNLDDASHHLASYVESHPDHLVIRARYAELLLRQNRLPEARAEFERFVADAQNEGGVAAKHLIHCHSRLMEIAEENEDGYAEHLHRGIGLYLLARERETLPDPEEELPVEGLLCRAAAELTLARQERADEAQPYWYLYEVWSRLGQSQPARRWLRQAADVAPFTYLTPAEQRRLTLAWQRFRDVNERW